MNTLALCDGILALVALAFGWRGRHRVDVRVAAGLLAAAATLGVLRYLAIVPDPHAHRLFSLLAGAVGLPALAHALVTEARVPGRRSRLACLLLASTASAAWRFPALAPLVRVASVASVGAIVREGARTQSHALLLVGSLLLVAFVGLAAKLTPPGLAPEDVLHLGMALALLAAMRAVRAAR
jgi:hypothetical protein